MRRIALILVLVAGTCWADTYYISPAGNDGTGDGLALETAWRSFYKAASEAATGDTIMVAAGAYPETDTTNRISLNSGFNGKALTFTATGAAIVTANNSGGALNDSAGTCTSGTFTFNGITFQNADTSTNASAVTLSTAASSVSLVFSNCTFAPSSLATTHIRYVFTTSADRNLTCTNCTFTAQSESPVSQAFVNSTSATNITLSGCTFNWYGGSSQAAALIQFGGAASAVLTKGVVSGCTFNANAAGLADGTPVISTGTLAAGNVIIQGNTIVAGGPAIRVPAAAASTLAAWIDRNTLSVYDTIGSACTGVRMGTAADTGTALGKQTFTNNVVRAYGTDYSITMVHVGPECTGAVVAYNDLLGQSVLSATDTGLGLDVQGADYVAIVGNSIGCRSGLTLVMADDATVLNNTVWTPLGDTATAAQVGAVAIRDETVGSGEGDDAFDCVLMNNIFAATGTTDVTVNCYPHGTGTISLATWLFDANQYYTSNTNVFQVVDGTGTHTAATAALVNTYFGTLSGICTANEANGNTGNPKFADAAAGYLRPGQGAPLSVIGQLSRTLRDSITRGAWSRMGQGVVVGETGIRAGQ